jgi:hypothetical protein
MSWSLPPNSGCHRHIVLFAPPLTPPPGFPFWNERKISIKWTKWWALVFTFSHQQYLSSSPSSRTLQPIPPVCWFFFVFWPFLNKIWEMNSAKTFFKSGPFQSRQFGWRNSWRNHTIWTGVIRRGGACPGVDVAPHRPQSRQSGWHDWVTPPAVARLVAQPPRDTCALVAPVRLAWLVECLNRRQLSSSSLSSRFLLSSLSRPSGPPPSLPPSASPGHHSSPKSVLIIPKGCSSLWTA